MMLMLVCAGLIILPTLGLQVAYEKVELLFGGNVLESTLRVRKYNHTTAVLNGTVCIKTALDDTFVVHTDLFHSPLGNQQFNHYPMKIPTSGMCKFFKNVHENYHFAIKDILNYPQKGECPVKPREVHVIDQVFPSHMVPNIFPKGLWKTLVTTKVDDVDRMKFETVLKAYDDLYF